ncbi:mitochondrial fission ELM1 family protein [Caulobacter sp. KR2-114]|uniref:mitochondrial fission ELM1 family protein n=1 Tax=Caulobacter sp. KR2-114 TaxID=3400912 RepID=UPI003C09DE6B
MTGRPLIIWAVSDGRAGIEAQALGLAEAVAHHVPALLSAKHVAWRGPAAWLPPRLHPASKAWLQDPSLVGPPWPDLWIAAGRASVPLSMHVRRRSGGRTFVVQLQDPRAPLDRFDLVVPPEHDGLAGANVFPILGAPTRITLEKLGGKAHAFAEALAPLPHPRVAVLIGGKSRAHDLTPARARSMTTEVAEAVSHAGGSVMVTFSRRTPAPARAILAEAWARLPGMIWDGQGPNPYLAFLAAADALLVTEDSTNLAIDAGATGKPVHVLTMDGHSPKFDRFHAALRVRGVARPFAGRLESWTYEPLDETERAAREVLRRMGADG